MREITKRLRLADLKDLRSYLGAVNQMNRLISALASIRFSFRDLLKKHHHEKAFNEVNEKVKKKPFHTFQNKTLYISNARKKGVGSGISSK